MGIIRLILRVLLPLQRFSCFQWSYLEDYTGDAMRYMASFIMELPRLLRAHDPFPLRFLFPMSFKILTVINSESLVGTSRAVRAMWMSCSAVDEFPLAQNLVCLVDSFIFVMRQILVSTRVQKLKDAQGVSEHIEQSVIKALPGTICPPKL